MLELIKSNSPEVVKALVADRWESALDDSLIIEKYGSLNHTKPSEEGDQQ